MQDAASAFDPVAVSARLEAGWEAMPWPERQSAAIRAIDSVSRDGAVRAAITLIQRLAEDPKWEVRKVVADGLLVLPDVEFQRLTAKLLDDRNAYVRKSAERAVDRRRLGQKVAARRRRSGDEVREQYDSLVERYGVKAAQHSMKMALQMYDLFVGSSVHEMRNVLTPLKSSAQHLQKQIDAGDLVGPDGQRRIGTMLDWIDTLEQLLDDMRTYAQATPQEREPERLLHLVTQAYQMAMEWFRGKELDISGITVRIDVTDDIDVLVSRHQVLLAFKNIIKNAVDAFALDAKTFRPGEITVTGRRLGFDEVEVVILDNGMGLNRMELAEVQRMVPGKSAKPHGTGYGLPTAQRRISEHGGTLAIDSVEDRGTSVTITLPLQADSGE